MIGTFNNEAISLLAIQSVLSFNPNLNLANIYLITPLLFDKKIRAYFKNKNTKIISFQDVVTSKSDIFIGFNEKYQDSLICTTNSIIMGNELGVFKIVNGRLIELKKFLDSEKELGIRLDGIFDASKEVAELLSESTDVIYKLLRLEL